MLIVSKCLAGFPCRYDGKTKPDPEIVMLVKKGLARPVCPEEMGGLPTPRVPAELTGPGELVLIGKAHAVTHDGRDVTREYAAGAYAALRAAKECGAKCAILKSRSPSCGEGEIYDGSFTGRLVPGDGVTAALLKQNGIRVESR